MCVYSMVMDHYDPLIPSPLIIPEPGPVLPIPQLVSWPPPIDLSELRQLIEEFKAAVEAAKTIDRLTGQPDCEDPAKLKLVDRVVELERRLRALEKPKKKSKKAAPKKRASKKVRRNS